MTTGFWALLLQPAVVNGDHLVVGPGKSMAIPAAMTFRWISRTIVDHSSLMFKLVQITWIARATSDPFRYHELGRKLTTFLNICQFPNKGRNAQWPS